MIRYLEGDIFATPAQTIVNTVNTVGVMGKGIALEFKKRYPSMFEKYKIACEKKKLKIGNLMLCYEADHWALLFPTKEHWRNPSRLEYIEQGLMKFCNTYAEYGITSIAFPKLGCGNGELNWDVVKPLMEKYLKTLPIDVYIYTSTVSDSLPEHKDQNNMSNWLKQNAKDISFDGFCDDIRYNCSIIPYVFYSQEKKIEIVWNDGIKMNDGVEEKNISEDILYEYWDKIRRKDVVYRENEQVPTVILDMIFSLGYFTKIYIVDGNDKKEGYQLNEGIGRYYSLEGTVNV
ncbi:O-acetyl-ADP-ribose deacetylase (regulator of RNase III), contains Macro domain [Butyrivibrio proteoclasticus]|uniref:O-acetyl-ADP-ribose deacetylase (Regulator of RNase III), contains Macro domain n=1 Tax=Butyrivibrio proteoclasticus TaxID=43305 RepID=A0A1I5Q0M9_9FIRM|nr:O-acetyl-ADP-ribose deacetylase (regulator of RNase III), contains Macro domain [Butyrivibrio proteoclasticus]